MRLIASWEHKTEKKIAEKTVERCMTEMRAQRLQDLEARRRKSVRKRIKSPLFHSFFMLRLAELLESDDRRYADEFLAMQETPEQIKERMEARARELKQKHESEREAFAKQQLERQFRFVCFLPVPPSSPFPIRARGTERALSLYDGLLL